MLAWVVEPQASLPRLMKPLRGHRSESTVCGQVVSDPLAQRPPLPLPLSWCRQGPLSCRESAHAGPSSPQGDSPRPRDLARGAGGAGPGAASDHGLTVRGLSRGGRSLAVWWGSATLGSHLRGTAPAAGPAHARYAVAPAEGPGRPSLQDAVPARVGLCRGCPARTHPVWGRLADPGSPRQPRLRDASLWEARTPRPWGAARPPRLPSSRGLGVAAPSPSGAPRPAALCYPRDERTGRGAVLRPGGARRLYRARPGGTRVSLPESPAVFGLLALPQKAPAPHGPGEGDDGLLAGVWSPGVSDSPRPQGAGGHLAGPKRQAPPEPDRTLGVP